jgi:uncharacterized protein (DUF488 family)
MDDDDGGPTPLLTVGHGTASQEELAELLTDAGVDLVVDVRRFPGSRRHPHVGQDALATWLPAADIDYRWEPRLGGRRRLEGDGAEHGGLRNTSFRAYAQHTDEVGFTQAVDELLGEADHQAVAVMCSESLWWRCHRRLIADAVTLLHHRPVRHLLHDGRLTDHTPTDVVRVVDEQLRYDGGQPHLAP